MHAVLDANVLIAGVLSREGAPAQLVSRWLGGEFELIVSEALLAELERALHYPRLPARLSAVEVEEFVALVRHGALVAPDIQAPARRSADSGDDYLVALAESQRALVVSGDRHLLALRQDLPIQTPRDFLNGLKTREDRT